MRTPPWFEAGGDRGLRRLGLLPLSVLSWGYGGATRLHRWWWSRGPGERVRLPCKVVSVGSLVVGGAGKTPTAAWIASGLRRRGHRVALASRGYGRSRGDRIEIASDGRRVHGSVERVGDEALLLAALAPGAPVLVGPRRDAVGQRAIAAFGAQVLVLDDGFQHHRLQRDLDLVVLPGAGGLGSARVLPRGPLREPLTGLSRADAVGVVDGPLSPEDERRVEGVAPGALRFRIERRASFLRSLQGDQRRPSSRLAGTRVGLLCGLGRPAAFRATLRELKVQVVAERIFPDHHRYRARDLVGLSEQASLWLTTEKDALKLLPSWARGAEVWVVELETRVIEGEALLDWIEERLRARPGGRPLALPSLAV